MIALLRGRLVEKHPNRVILDVHGVGYDVQVPLSSFYALGEPGSEVCFRVHTHVREDALQLYGFGTRFEQSLFERLIGIGGIGPRLALAVLSGIEPADLVSAVQRGDVARLTAIPGVGRKTAERIVLELKDRLASLEPPGGPPPAAGPRDDLVSALVNLGYHRAAAEKAVDRTLRSSSGLSFEDALRESLKLIR